MAKLGDLCKNQTSSIKLKDLENHSGEYPIYGAGGLIQHVNFYQQERPYIAVVKDGAGVGRVMLLPEFSSVIGTMQYILPNAETNAKYLAYAMQYMNLAKYRSGATIPHIYFRDYKNESVREYSPEMQQQIADTLDKVTHTIDLCHAMLEKLDLLVKARFVEMFGDPRKNTQNRPTTKLINVVKMQRGFDLPVYNRNSAGNIPVYGANGVLSKHDTAKVFGGGVITGRSGTIGKVYYTLNDYFPLNTTLFSSDLHGNNIIYLAYLLELFDLTRFKEGTGVPTLNRNKFHKEFIIDVPIIQQQQFADFAGQAENAKSAVKQVLKQAETLKQSLMQEYFGNVL